MTVRQVWFSIYFIFLFVVTLWCAVFLLVPVLTSGGPGSRLWGLVIRQFFAPICHQMPERSFYLYGEPLAVCARCSGIYIGFWMGIIAYPVFFGRMSTRTVSRNVLILALLPMVADVFIEWTGFYAAPRWMHALTGLVAGSVSAFIILPGLLGAVSWFIEKRSHHGSIC